jgi:hypothetical protein
MTSRIIAVTCLLAGTVIAAAPARADALPDPATESASCMGSGSAFYGTFAPQQRAFVAQYVVEQATATGTTPGSIYVVFATEKEGGSIPAPCGTRIE